MTTTTEIVVDQAARDYQAEGAVYFAHIGCRQAYALIRPMRDLLRDELDMSMVVIDCDIVDPSFSSGEEMQSKLEGFFEMLEDNAG